MELDYLKMLILIYQVSPQWTELHPNRATAHLMKERLVDAGLAETCKVHGIVHTPDPGGRYIRLTDAGTQIVLAAARLLPKELHSEH